MTSHLLAWTTLICVSMFIIALLSQPSRDGKRLAKMSLNWKYTGLCHVIIPYTSRITTLHGIYLIKSPERHLESKVYCQVYIQDMQRPCYVFWESWSSLNLDVFRRSWDQFPTNAEETSLSLSFLPLITIQAFIHMNINNTKTFIYIFKPSVITTIYMDIHKCIHTYTQNTEWKAGISDSLPHWSLTSMRKTLVHQKKL